jgi:hypothetical protein
MLYRKYQLGFGFKEPTGMKPAPRHSIPYDSEFWVIMLYRKYQLGFGFKEPTGMKPAPRHSIPYDSDCDFHYLRMIICTEFT